MKKGYVFFMISMIVSLFLFTDNVFAAKDETKKCTACQLSELRQMAAKVKISYIPKTETAMSEDIEPGVGEKVEYTKRYIDIKIYNLNTRLYVRVTNNIGLEEIVSTNDAVSDGSITFRQPALNNKVDYKFEILSSRYGCETTTLRTIRITLPLFNTYSQLDICSEIPNYYLCQEYITKPVDGSTFYDKVDAYKEKLSVQDDNEEESNTGVVNKVFKGAAKFKYLIVGVVVAIGVLITVLIIKRKENF